LLAENIFPVEQYLDAAEDRLKETSVKRGVKWNWIKRDHVDLSITAELVAYKPNNLFLCLRESKQAVGLGPLGILDFARRIEFDSYHIYLALIRDEPAIVSQLSTTIARDDGIFELPIQDTIIEAFVVDENCALHSPVHNHPCGAFDILSPNDFKYILSPAEHVAPIPSVESLLNEESKITEKLLSLRELLDHGKITKRAYENVAHEYETKLKSLKKMISRARRGV